MRMERLRMENGPPEASPSVPAASGAPALPRLEQGAA